MVNRELNYSLDKYIGQLRKKNSLPIHKKITAYIKKYKDKIKKNQEIKHNKEQILTDNGDNNDFNDFIQFYNDEKENFIHKLKKLFLDKFKNKREEEIMDLDKDEFNEAILTKEDSKQATNELENQREDKNSEKEISKNSNYEIKESNSNSEIIIKQEKPDKSLLSDIFSKISSLPSKLLSNKSFASIKKDEEEEINDNNQRTEFELEVEQVMNIVNELFKKLPAYVKYEFKKSPEYEIYSNFLKKYKIRKLY